MSNAPAAYDDLRVVGVTPWPVARIVAAAEREAAPPRYPGDFVVAADRNSDPGRDVLLVSSAIGAYPYYYTQAPHGRLVHGTEVFDVVRRSGLPWRWNERALRSLTMIGHLLDDETLHPDVHRMPAGAVVRYRAGRLEVRREGALSAALTGPRTSVDDAIDAFLVALADIPGEPLMLCLTAGLDSRAILAGLIHLGRRPLLNTAGASDHPDRVLAERIARDLGLEHAASEIRPSDYLDHGAEIATLTSGEIPAMHWHSRFLVGDRRDAELNLKGTNGEFARSFYFDRGAQSLVVDASPVDLVLPQFLARAERWHRRYRRPPEFVRSIGLCGRVSFARRLASLCRGPRGTLDRLDLFYAEQRVRRCIGGGVRLTSAVVPSTSPFLDWRWIHTAAGLPRRAKLGGTFHRALIARCAPALMRYPLGRERKLGRRPPRLYWLGAAHAPTGRFGSVLELPATREVLMDSPHLDAFATRAEREAVTRHGDLWESDLLMTLHFAAEASSRITSER
jgi:hypothetical protein